MYKVKFGAHIEAEEMIKASSHQEAREKASAMAGRFEVGEHQLEVDWDIDGVELTDEDPEEYDDTPDDEDEEDEEDEED
jgi:hypothetical protein